VVVSLGLIASVMRYAQEPPAVVGPQRSAACTLSDIARVDGDLWAIGDPTPLVLTGLTNPDRFVFIGSGTAEWKVDQLDGGLAHWQQDLVDGAPKVVVIMGVSPNNGYANSFKRVLRAEGYMRRFAGEWRLFVTAAVAEEFAEQLTDQPTRFSKDAAGAERKTC
jgi:hypothetical protein